MVGVDLPVTPLKRQILFTEPIAGLPDDLPMTIDFESTFYFHREGPGLLLGMSDPDEQPGFDLADDRRLGAGPDRRCARAARRGSRTRASAAAGPGSTR